MSSAGVLAGRIAATLVHHEPGWRLPRLTTLARRYQASSVEIEAAIDDLVRRHLVRRLPDGQLYRASPAEYQLALEGIAGLASHVDPMGGQLTCTSRHASRRRVPEEISRALGLAPGALVLAIKCLWAVGGEPGALSASYIPEQFAEFEGAGLDGDHFWPAPVPASRPAEPVAGVPAAEGGISMPLPFPLAFPLPLRAAVVGARPRALQIEMSQPPPAAARRLRVSAGEPVLTVTASFANTPDGPPVALTTAMLRPELFRVVVEAGHAPIPSDGLVSAWTQGGQCWES
jgi:DNA-binding GntR family transcriptional regulator